MWVGVRTRAWAPAGHGGCRAVQGTPGRAPGPLRREGQTGWAVGAGTPPGEGRLGWERGVPVQAWLWACSVGARWRSWGRRLFSLAVQPGRPEPLGRGCWPVPVGSGLAPGATWGGVRCAVLGTRVPLAWRGPLPVRGWGPPSWAACSDSDSASARPSPCSRLSLWGSLLVYSVPAHRLATAGLGEARPA